MKTVISMLAGAAVLALAACQNTPRENADLNAARTAVTQAGQSPSVANGGALELERAQRALARAEKAWADDRNEAETQHLSYLALQRAEIARLAGAQARADEALKTASAERERVRLEARTREADAAVNQARAAQDQAANATARALAAQANAQSAQASAQSAHASAQNAQATARTAQEEAQAQAERAAALERDLRELQARNTARGMVVTIGDVLFDSGRATLQSGALRNVAQLAAVLKQHPERRVLIEGYTDSVGSNEMNLQLSQRRAEAFREALLRHGVAPERMEARAFGEANPVADNGSAAGRQQNRRVEILFSDGRGQFAMR